jgi:hypothetical protein
MVDFPYRLPHELMQEFGVFTGKPWADWEIEPAICDAIRAYMKPQPAASAQMGAVTDAGYQWKEVFLPEGTRLRASFGRAPYFAVVQGSEIRCGEQSLSPSAFANLKGSGNRNAWKAIWLRFPGSEQWVLADTGRAQQKALIARLFGTAEPEPATVKHRGSGKRHKHKKQHKQRAVRRAASSK